jgi:hypothetical protein
MGAQTLRSALLQDLRSVPCKHAASANYAEPGIVVAAESSALLVIDGQDKVQVILDSGCQIVAMNKHHGG